MKPLNLDVLLNVMAHLSNKGDISRMAKTCHTLHSAAIPFLLRHPVQVIEVEAFRSFCTFMISKLNRSRRFEYFRTLHLIVDLPSHERCPRGLGGLFAKILRRAKKLEELHMNDICDFIKSGPFVIDAFASLPNLKVFTVDSFGLTGLSLLRQMHSPLRSANLTFYSSRWDNDPGDLTDPITLFNNFRSSLKSLRLVRVHPCNGEIVYHKVHTLHLETEDPFSIATIIHAFPNLSRFSVATFNSEDQVDAEVVEARDASRVRIQLRKGTWSELHYLQGCVTDLFKLGLTCRVRHLDVGPVSSLNKHRFLELLGDLSPSKLAVQLDVASFTNTGLEDLIQSALGNPDRTHMKIQLDLKTGVSDPLTVFKILEARVRGSALQYLFLCIRYEAPLNTSPTSTSPLIEQIKGLDAKEAVSQFSKAAPSLSYVFFDCGFGSVSYWRVDRSGKGEIVPNVQDHGRVVALEQLDKGTGEEIARGLDML